MKKHHHFFRIWILTISLVTFTHYLLQAQSGLIPYRDPVHHTHGYKDRGNIIIPAKYEEASSFYEDMAGVKLNGKWGFINSRGNEVIPFIYDDPGTGEMFSYFFSDGMAAVLLNGKFGFIDKKGKEIVPIIYDFGDPFEDGIGAVALNHKWGLVNKAGKAICPLRYDEALGGGWIRLNNKWALMDSAGKELTLFKYDHQQHSFYEDVAIVEVNGKYGYINRRGMEIAPVAYQKASGFSEGLAAVKMDNKWGFIDKAGKQVIPLQYDDVKISFKDGKAVVIKDGKKITIDNPLINSQPANDDKISNTNNAQESLERFKDSNGKYGFKNKSGNIVIPAKYENADLFSEGMAGIQLNGNWGFINTTGKEVIPPQYEMPARFDDFEEDAFYYEFHEGMAAVFLKNRYGFIDKKGTEVVPVKYYNVKAFNNGFAGVTINGGWGFVNKAGKEVTPVKYEDIRDFDKSMAAVKMDGKWGLINKAGKEICPIKYDNASGDGWVELGFKWALMDSTGKELTLFKYFPKNSFVEDMAMVVAVGKFGFINRQGIEIAPPKYQSAHKFSEGLAGIEMAMRWGFIDKNGKEVIPLIYEAIKDFSEGMAAVKMNGKWGFVNDAGKEVISSQYDAIEYSFKNGKAVVRKDGKTITIDKSLINSHPENKDQTSNTDIKTNNTSVASVPLVKPPIPLKGKIDPTLVGLWKYTDASGRITYMKMNADGTSESYLNSVTPANRSKGFCYWLIDGSFYESVCDGAASVNRYTFQKGYDKATGKPTLNLAGYIYIAADNKTSW